MTEMEFEKLRAEFESLKREVRRLRTEAGAGGSGDGEDVQPSQPIMFPVDLNQVGGSAGDATTECTFTYDVSDLYGNTLDTGVGLSTSRHIISKMKKATHGTAYLDTDGNLVLWWCDEQEDTQVCTGGA